jgi:hypothetical protein
MNFLIDPHKEISLCRPTNITVYGWVGGKHNCVDVTEIFPVLGLGVENMIKCAPAIDMFLYHLHFAHSVF